MHVTETSTLKLAWYARQFNRFGNVHSERLCKIYVKSNRFGIKFRANSYLQLTMFFKNVRNLIKTDLLDLDCKTRPLIE